MKSLKYDEEYERLNAEPWMRNAVALNPEYVFWAPGDDYMEGVHENGGWSSAIECETWKDLSIELDQWNEVVHFYFEIVRDNKACPDCEGTGYTRAARRLRDGFFGPHGWHKHLDQDEVDALVAANRLMELTHTLVAGAGWQKKDPPVHPTAAEVNEAAVRGAFFPHDSINASICVEARCKKLKTPLLCQACKGEGRVFTSERAHLELVLWLLHPRKGASRGVTIKRVEKEDVVSACQFLAKAAQRNADRFAHAVNWAREAARHAEPAEEKT